MRNTTQPDYTFDGIGISFSSHAIDRIQERFGFVDHVEIPNRLITLGSKMLRPGGEFKVKASDKTFVCEKKSETLVSVVTVY